MPEGDNILRVATVLTRELAGKTLDQLQINDQGVVEELAGRRVESIESHGKQMFVHIEGGWSLRVHLGMKGSWLRRHTRQVKPAGWTAILSAGEVAYVCVGAYRAELMKTHLVRKHPRMARLGPDLLHEPPDINGVMQRAQLPAHAGREIGEVLLDQRIAAGI